MNRLELNKLLFDYCEQGDWSCDPGSEVKDAFIPMTSSRIETVKKSVEDWLGDRPVRVIVVRESPTSSWWDIKLEYSGGEIYHGLLD